MERTVVFGTGKVLERYFNELPFEKVDAFVDNNPEKWGRDFHGRKILSPKELNAESVYRVYIATNKYFYEIYEQLIMECHIPKEKVKGISCLLPLREESFDGGRKIGEPEQVVGQLAETLVSIGASSVLDVADGLRDYGVLSPYDHRLSAWRETGRWRFVKDAEKDCPDTVLFVDPFARISVECLINKIHQTRRRWNADCLITACGPWDEESDAWAFRLRQEFSDVLIQQLPSCIVAVVRGKKKASAQIFAVTHKKYRPVFWAGAQTGYESIVAGAQGKPLWDGLRDDEGYNISRLNEKINECTAIYWIWKYRPQEIIGFSHYRRYFLNRKGTSKERRLVLSIDAARRYLRNVDILVADPLIQGEGSVEKGIQNSTQREAFECGRKLIRKNIEKYQPTYVQTFEDVMHSLEMYPCNMFVTRWEIFDAYCTWLFSFLIPAAEEADVSRFDAYSKRIIGFFAERMLTVWLVKHPEIRIKTLPILQTDA